MAISIGGCRCGDGRGWKLALPTDAIGNLRWARLGAKWAASRKCTVIDSGTAYMRLKVIYTCVKIESLYSGMRNWGGNTGNNLPGYICIGFYIHNQADANTGVSEIDILHL